jgi:chitin deacetylase
MCQKTIWHPFEAIVWLGSVREARESFQNRLMIHSSLFSFHQTVRAIMALSCFTILFVLFPLASTASVLPTRKNDLPAALPDTWFHPPDHPIHSLFRRQTQTGFDTPTTACVNEFPPLPDPVVPMDSSTMPQPWKAYFGNHCEGDIPDIPRTTASPSGPKYPRNYDPTSPQVCSATYKSCRMEGDIWDAPDGYMALGFDDGPWLVSG